MNIIFADVIETIGSQPTTIGEVVSLLGAIGALIIIVQNFLIARANLNDRKQVATDQTNAIACDVTEKVKVAVKEEVKPMADEVIQRVETATNGKLTQSVKEGVIQATEEIRKSSDSNTALDKDRNFEAGRIAGRDEERVNPTK